MKLNLLILLTTLFALNANAKVEKMDDELNPYADNIEEVLLENDLLNADSRVFVEEEPVMSSEYVEVIDEDGSVVNGMQTQDCFRDTCAVFIEVDKSSQRAYIRINGELLEDKSGSLKGGILRATTGMKGHSTPNFDRHPDKPLRIYKRYSSSKYPGGNWYDKSGKAFGNMPFAVFIKGGFAVHGTTGTDGNKNSNIGRLGTVPLSHGCIRLHPLNAKVFNEAVAIYGANKTWIWVHE